MDKHTALGCGTLVGIIPAVWVGAYLFHVKPLDVGLYNWWEIPWVMTVIFIVIVVAGISALVFNYMFGNDDRQ